MHAVERHSGLGAQDESAIVLDELDEMAQLRDRHWEQTAEALGDSQAENRRQGGEGQLKPRTAPWQGQMPLRPVPPKGRAVEASLAGLECPVTQPTSPRLILLEGGPATGKSTTAAFLHRSLPGSNLYTEFGCENPIYDSWVLMKYVLQPAGIALDEPERSEVEAMAKMTAEEFQESTLRSLEVFSATSIPVSIFDGTFLGNTLMILLLYFEIDEASVLRALDEMIARVRHLNPLLIYYYKRSPEETVAEMEIGRPGHLAWVTRLLLDSPYARRHGLEHSTAGLATVAEELFRLGRAVFDRCQIPKLSLRSSAAVWRQQPDLHERVYEWVIGH